MDEKFNSLLSVVIVPQVIDIIMTKEKLDELSAINEFYNSRIYNLLSDEETKIWHYSPMAIYTIWKHEKENDKNIFLEG